LIGVPSGNLYLYLGPLSDFWVPTRGKPLGQGDGPAYPQQCPVVDPDPFAHFGQIWRQSSRLSPLLARHGIS
jgi:hypothetical protein